LLAWARQQGFASFYAAPADTRAALQSRLTDLTRKNTYDPATGTLMLDNDRAAAFTELAAYYANVYGKGRNEYAIPAGALSEPSKQREMAAFFFWTAWAASTNRPDRMLRTPRTGRTKSSSVIASQVLPSCGASSVLCYCWRGSEE
jgi:nitric oxide reductase subunit B